MKVLPALIIIGSLGSGCSDLNCPEGTVACGDECRDITGDPEACGGCNAGACGDREYCDQGVCACRPGLSDCSGTCVDTNSDPAHCGGCDQACAEVCTGGVCGAAAACTLTIYEGACVDLAFDPLNCGSCGHACAVDQVCFAGGCWYYEPALGCETCAECDACPEKEPCCDLPGYFAACVDSPQPCPY